VSPSRELLVVFVSATDQAFGNPTFSKIRSRFRMENGLPRIGRLLIFQPLTGSPSRPKLRRTCIHEAAPKILASK
jgi:hypothetical protein